MQEKIFPATLMPDPDWWHTLWPDPDATIAKLGIHAGLAVVDLCCGDGYFTAAIARRVGTGRVIGFDLDPTLLEQAKAACQEQTNCTWINGDASDLGRLINGKVDYVLIANTFHGVPDPTALSREVAAILKRDGKFAIVNWHPRPREETTVLGQPRGPRTDMRMSPEAVQAVVEPAGFGLESVVDLGPYHYGAIFVATTRLDNTANHSTHWIEMSDNHSHCGEKNPLDQIRMLYTKLALQPGRDFGWGKGMENARQLGYADDWLACLPDVVWESAAAVGNPFGVGPIHRGETVIDLGCGAGADACVAALLVGTAGKVYGFDVTPAMVAKARSNAEVAGLSQVEFREADMGHLDLADAIADVVISNGAINLALDKPKVFAEVFRVLRSGGRFQFADMVREREEGVAYCSSDSSWADCVSGTLEVEEVKVLLHKAGFTGVQLIGSTGYKTSSTTVGVTFSARKP